MSGVELAPGISFTPNSQAPHISSFATRTSLDSLGELLHPLPQEKNEIEE